MPTITVDFVHADIFISDDSPEVDSSQRALKEYNNEKKKI